MVAGATDWAEWTAISGFAAAAATVFLGLVTVWLVITTKRLVGGANDELAATRQLAQATRDEATNAAIALALQVEPRIIPVHDFPPRFEPLENVGNLVA